MPTDFLNRAQVKMFTGLVTAWLSLATPSAATAQSSPPAPRVVALMTSDGTLLKATYFSAGTPGPGVLLFHQANRTRSSWEGLSRQLAAAGINSLAVDGRGHGDSGGTRKDTIEKTPSDMETVFQFLISQPGVRRDVIGLAGAGSYGVINAAGNSPPSSRRHQNPLSCCRVIPSPRASSFSTKLRSCPNSSSLPTRTNIPLPSRPCSGYTPEPPVLWRK